MNELDKVTQILTSLGYALDTEQPHISGERFLMAKNKLVLMGEKDSTKVAIKISNVPEGIRDITNEKHARDLLQSLNFADNAIIFPREGDWQTKDGYTVWATQFIEQDKVFVEYPIEEQFFMALNAFEAQESFHATTYEHLGKVKNLFPILYAQDYFKEFDSFKTTVDLKPALQLLRDEKRNIDKYSNYLSHTDFVPMNFRVRDHKLYMLDCAPEVRTVHFGNKYEGWARFLNYMVIHNPKLDTLLSDYVRKNRGEEDYLSLRLMRIYKIGFLLEYYTESLSKTEGDLHELTRERIDFWNQILQFILEDKSIPNTFVEEYKQKRDNLRSEEEKKRQREFSVA